MGWRCFLAVWGGTGLQDDGINANDWFVNVMSQLGTKVGELSAYGL